MAIRGVSYSRAAPLMLLIVALAVNLAGCGQTSDTERPASTVESADAAPESAGEKAPASMRDLALLDVCAAVPAAQVADALNLDERMIAAESTRRPGSSDCSYRVQFDEDRQEYLMIWVYPPELWYPEEDDVIESLDLGDAAYTSTMSTFSQVMVLAEGDFVLDVRAEDVDQAKTLARLAFLRLKESD